MIFIWEFSSAVSPTSIGGSAVALFVLAQEKLSTARTATIVIYTIVLDAGFFVLTLPVLLLLFGSSMIRPGIEDFSGLGIWGIYFIVAYCLMAIYGSWFIYGLFVNPNQFSRVLKWVTNIKWLKKWQIKAVELGQDMAVASRSIRRKPWTYHLSVFVSTVMAWSCRFLLLNCLIIGFEPQIPLTWFDQGALYARLESMFVIIAFSPTPGGAGFVELLFGSFMSDYIETATSATVISTIWRLFTYYSYLIIGAIIIPNWLRMVLNARRVKRMRPKDTLGDSA